jgi:hypothetical protein
MGPPSYTRSVVNRNVVMRRTPVIDWQFTNTANSEKVGYFQAIDDRLSCLSLAFSTWPYIITSSINSLHTKLCIIALVRKLGHSPIVRQYKYIYQMCSKQSTDCRNHCAQKKLEINILKFCIFIECLVIAIILTILTTIFCTCVCFYSIIPQMFIYS